jgi:NAD(P)H-hydrate epimerase
VRTDDPSPGSRRSGRGGLADAEEEDEDALLSSVDVALQTKRAVVVGPGFGIDPAARRVSRHILTTFRGAIVADADVFSLHAGAPEDFAVAGGRAILTPHAGELGRILGSTAIDVESDRFGAAREAAERAKAVVLLKGSYSIVAAPDGRAVVTNSGTPVLATAGSGDVLAGLVAALACTLPPFEAAWCGAYIHGLAGAAWEKAHGDRGLLASEIADGLPSVLASLLGGDG